MTSLLGQIYCTSTLLLFVSQEIHNTAQNVSNDELVQVSALSTDCCTDRLSLRCASESINVLSRWDTYGRLVAPHTSRFAWAVIEGNHELEVRYWTHSPLPSALLHIFLPATAYRLQLHGPHTKQMGASKHGLQISAMLALYSRHSSMQLSSIGASRHPAKPKDLISIGSMSLLLCRLHGMDAEGSV